MLPTLYLIQDRKFIGFLNILGLCFALHVLRHFSLIPAALINTAVSQLDFGFSVGSPTVYRTVIARSANSIC